VVVNYPFRGIVATIYSAFSEKEILSAMAAQQ
jgi:hypothetical protein